MSFAELLKAALFGVVEGITEWLPISSTGHMILLNEFVKLDVSPEFWNLFLVVIQLGAILAVVFLYRRTIWPLRVVRRRDGTKHIVWKRQTLQLWAKIFVACIPAGIVGVLFDDWIDAHFQNWQCVSIMLVLVGILFIIIENIYQGRVPTKRKLGDITYRDAFIIGLCQLVAAVFPGTSRSGSTILGGMMLGMSRPAATKFTYILAIPVMAGASLLKIVKYGFAFSGQEVAILVTGMVIAFVISFVAIRLFINYIRTHNFKPFGVYRIVLGIVMALYFLFLKG